MTAGAPRILGLGPVAAISVAQLFGTSLWFSANSAADGLMRDWGATPADIGALTNAVQAGFIIGTLALSLSGAPGSAFASWSGWRWPGSIRSA